MCMIIFSLLFLVNLTKTGKKGKDLKGSLIEQIRTALDTYSTVYVFAIENMRTELLQSARANLKGRARFFIGKNRVMAKALGTTLEDEQREGISQLASKLSGEVGLLFVREEESKGYELKTEEGEALISEEELISYLDSLEQGDFARPGSLATETVTVPSGPLITRDGLPVPSNLEGQVRQCGMPVTLIRGVVVVPEGPDRVICNEGDKLNADQARLLKLLNYQMVTFRIRLLCRYRNGVVADLESSEESETEIA
jgi:mRNA turnover protein 4